MATNTSSQDLKTLGINLVKSKTAWQQMLAAGNIIKPDEFYLVQGDEAITYSFTDGDNGTFTVTPSEGTAITVDTISNYLTVEKGGTGRSTQFSNPGGKILIGSANGTSIVEISNNVGSANLPIWINNGIPTAMATGATINVNAASASKLSPGATIALSGAVTGTATTFTGESAITIPTTGINFGTSGITIEGSLPIENGGTGRSTEFSNPGGKVLISSSNGTSIVEAGTVGSKTKFIYLNAGVASVSDSDVGASDKPIYMDDGELKASSSSIGGTAKGVYLDQGQIKALSADVGDETNPVYMDNGEIKSISHVAIEYGGTGAETESGARINLGLGNAKIYYGTCSTAAGTTTKEVTCSEFPSSLTEGLAIIVKFSNTNSGAVGSLQLKVGSTAAKPLKYEYNGTAANLPAVGYLRNSTYLFVYDGTNWVCQGINYNTDTATTVKQTLSTANKNYPLILSYAETSDTTADITNSTYRNNAIYANPSTGYIHAKFSADEIEDGVLPVEHGGTGNDTEYTKKSIIWADASTGVLKSAPYAHINYTAGTTSAAGYEELVLGNSTKTGTAKNAFGRLAIYSSGTKGAYITAAATDAAWNDHVIPVQGGWLVTAATAGVGGQYQPIYVNNSGIATAVSANTAIVNLESENSANIFVASPSIGIDGTLPITHGGTGNDEDITANRMVYSSSATKLFTASNIYASSDTIGVNMTSAPNSNYKFEVNGKSMFDDIVYLKASQYTDSAGTGSLNLQNSDIFGVNSIKFADEATSAEGLQWYRSATTVDSIWVKGGKMYFTPNRAWGSAGTSYYITYTDSTNGDVGDNTQPVYVDDGVIKAITKVATEYGGTGADTTPTANRVVWSNASSIITSSSMYTDGNRLGVNRTSISNADYKLEVTGISRFQGATLFSPSSDAVLKIYNVTNTTYGNETIAIQTAFDNVDPETSNYVSTYENRCNLLLQPRGGQVYIGENLTSVGSTNYSLLVTGASRFNDIHPATTSTSDSTGYDLGSSNNRWKYLYARNLNISNNIDVDNNLTVGNNLTVEVGATIEQTLTVGSSSTKDGVITLNGIVTITNETDAATHTSDGALIIKGGVNIAKKLRVADDIILYAADNNRSIIFGYSTTANSTTIPEASWRLAYLGAGTGDENYFEIESSPTSGQTGSGSWNTVMRLSPNTMNAYFKNQVNPLLAYNATTNKAQSVGTNALRWAEMFTQRLNVTNIRALDDDSINIQASDNTNTIYIDSGTGGAYDDLPKIYPYNDLSGALGDPNKRWGHLYVGEFAPDVYKEVTSGSITKDAWLSVMAGKSSTSTAPENKLEDGTYIIQIQIGTAYYSGVCSWVAAAGANNITALYSEIPLHGVQKNMANQYFLRTAMDGSGIYLQISQSSSTATSLSDSKLTIKMKKIMG